MGRRSGSYVTLPSQIGGLYQHLSVAALRARSHYLATAWLAGWLAILDGDLDTPPLKELADGEDLYA